MKPRVLLLCGGQSGEHQVSLRSGLSVIRELPKDKYDLVAVAIDKQGRWWTGSPLVQNPDNPETIALAPGLTQVRLEGDQLLGKKVDCVFSVLHGTYGEDGAMQGFLEMSKVAFVGPGVLGSAVAMDKEMTKRLLLFEGLKTAPYLVLRDTDKVRPTYAQAVEKLGPVLFVKPSAQGSSLGISKVKNEAQYQTALDFAFRYDRKILVEKGIVGREIELSVLGNDQLTVSLPGEIKPAEEFYSYEAKYILDNTTLVIPVPLPGKLVARLQEAAARVFRCLELKGMARVDFFVDAQEEIWVNEPNTLPGFTSISMYPKLMQTVGISYPELLDRLVQLGLEDAAKRSKLSRDR